MGKQLHKHIGVVLTFDCFLKKVGSGFLVSPNLVITAAHIVCKLKSKDNVVFYPGEYGYICSYFEVEDIYFPQQYT